MVKYLFLTSDRSFYLFDFFFEFCLRLYMDGYYFAECSGVQRGGAMGASAPTAREFDFYF